MSLKDPHFSSSTTYPKSSSLTQIRPRVVKKVFDLRKTRELLRSRYSVHSMNGNANIASGLQRKGQLENIGQGLAERQGRNQTPSNGTPSHLGSMAVQLPKRSSSQLLTEAKYGAKEKPMPLMSSTSAASLFPPIPQRQFPQETQLTKSKMMLDPEHSNAVRPLTQSKLEILKKSQAEGKAHNQVEYAKLGSITTQFPYCTHLVEQVCPTPITCPSDLKASQPIHIRRISEPSDIPNLLTRCAYKTLTGTKMRSPKKHNQDSFIIVPNLGGVKNQYAFGVFDGHGTYGHLISGKIAERLPQFIAENLLPSAPDRVIETQLQRGFELMQDDLVSSSIDCSLSGSTACLVLIRGTTVFTANLGDSRAVIGRKVHDTWRNRPLTRDHKPDWPDECLRITQAGGRVIPYTNYYGRPAGPHRVWLPHKDIPGLAMSRAFGDLIGSEVGITAIPELKSFSLTPDDKFIVIASDGLWEFMSSQEVVDIVSADFTGISAEATCEKLVQESVRRWNRQEDAVDDITVVVVYLNIPSAYLYYLNDVSNSTWDFEMRYMAVTCRFPVMCRCALVVRV